MEELTQNCTMENSEICYLGIAFRKIPDPDDFQCWRVNFKTEVCTGTSTPELAVSWINEVEMARSIDDLMTSQWITGESFFLILRCLMRWLRLHWRKLLTSVHFGKRVSVEEQRAQEYDNSYEGGKIAYIVYWHFRAIRTFEAVQCLSDLFNIRSHNDDVQDFDTRWGPISISRKWKQLRKWSWRVFLQVRLKDSVQLPTVLALCEQENIRNNEQPCCSRLKTSVRRHVWSGQWGREASEPRTK